MSGFDIFFMFYLIPALLDFYFYMMTVYFLEGPETIGEWFSKCDPGGVVAILIPLVNIICMFINLIICMCSSIPEWSFLDTIKEFLDKISVK